ncbi:delta(3,5)-Delta(2,4)-dienoyl-CoA isomerase, mitochondrial isoform X2 [Agelaius tricolor]|uniref:delta(3,5)-Delta(2,4)-dienoyl-CoA isomerase, mitochondrial isoform X2 n=1 Tax=Agelaius tricolor TaxID=9191 RepID=UPI0039F1CE78
MAAGVARLLRALCPSAVPVSRLVSSMSPVSPVPSPRELQTLRVTQERPQVLHVQLHRPSKRNALNLQCWRELVQAFQDISEDPSCRAVVVSGAGSAFTAGIDLADLGSVLAQLPQEDAARRAWALRRRILEFQESFSVMEKCPKPVIAAVHGPCIGAGVDLISACDIRFCSQDASFQVKEVDMGLAADVGTLQRLPKIVGSQSLVNELALTARVMRAPEALSCGLVSRVLPNKEWIWGTWVDFGVDFGVNFGFLSPQPRAPRQGVDLGSLGVFWGGFWGTWVYFGVNFGVSLSPAMCSPTRSGFGVPGCILGWILGLILGFLCPQLCAPQQGVDLGYLGGFRAAFWG